MQKTFLASLSALLLVACATPAVLSSTALADSRVDMRQLMLVLPQGFTPAQIQLPTPLPSYYPAPDPTSPVPTPAPAGTHTVSAPQPVQTYSSGPAIPVRLSVPSVGINAPIQGVGTKSNGEMDVPNGKSNNVGWYKSGPVPGQSGSAVLDAHVFAAFSALKGVKPGDSIYVTMSDGSTRHFVVTSDKSYLTAGLSSSVLFRPTSSPDLNLITCAGSLTADHSTYDHRLIVYSTLVRE